MSGKHGPTPRKDTPRVLAGIPGTVEPGYREKPIVEIPLPHEIKAYWDSLGLDWNLAGLRAYSMGACRIMVGREPQGVGGALLWHLTISTTSRHPTWDEIKTARYRLLPLDLVFAMFLPPPEHYVNVERQDHVMQLWEVYDERKQWRTH